MSDLQIYLAGMRGELTEARAPKMPADVAGYKKMFTKAATKAMGLYKKALNGFESAGITEGPQAIDKIEMQQYKSQSRKGMHYAAFYAHIPEAKYVARGGMGYQQWERILKAVGFRPSPGYRDTMGEKSAKPFRITLHRGLGGSAWGVSAAINFMVRSQEEFDLFDDLVNQVGEAGIKSILNSV